MCTLSVCILQSQDLLLSVGSTEDAAMNYTLLLMLTKELEILTERESKNGGMGAGNINCTVETLHLLMQAQNMSSANISEDASEVGICNTEEFYIKYSFIKCNLISRS